MDEPLNGWSNEQRAAHLRTLIASLRSGIYRQGRSRLRGAYMDPFPTVARVTPVAHVDEFCCLGVACDLVTLAAPDYAAWRSGPKYSAFVVEHREEWTTMPPPSVREYFGLTQKDVDVLVDLNDDKRLGFDHIADHIERCILPRYAHSVEPLPL